MYLLVGLGNPGMQYANTRHNIGFDALIALAQQYHIDVPHKKKHNALITDGTIAHVPCVLALPQQFMNLSGQPVISLMTFHKIPPQNVIVVHDDLDLPFASVKLKQKGGHGGHNGLRDIIKHIGDGFIRVRMGIGRPPENWDTSSFVLGKWTKQEQNSMPDMFRTSIEAIESIVRDGILGAMQKFNVKN
jgi:PTH1 family peptidyl-tRNA hydrolase